MDGYIIGLNISPDSSDADFYMITIADHGHAPEKFVMHDGYIILFRSLADADRVLRVAGMSDQVVIKSEEDMLTVDINNVFFFLKEGSAGKNRTLLGFYNTFLDICREGGFTLPRNYKRILYKFASHLMYENDFEAFFSETKITRKQVIDASLWLSGTLFAQTTFLESLLESADDAPPPITPALVEEPAEQP